MKNYRAFIGILAFFFVVSIHAQGNYHKGVLHLKKGKTKEVYIEIDFEYPQRFQQGITFMEPADYEKFIKTGKLKGKMKKKMGKTSLTPIFAAFSSASCLICVRM